MNARFLMAIMFLFAFMADAKATCYQQAAKQFQLDPLLLKAIAQVESSGNPNAVRVNKNATKDVGLMQINSIHLDDLHKRGITEEKLLNGCVNLKVGARILRGHINNYGLNWYAVGAYHSKTPSRNIVYQKKVIAEYKKLSIT